MNNWLAVALVGYLIMQFAIAYMASRFIKVEADYFVAGRKLGLYAVAMSVFATWFGAESVMGSSGAVAQEGLADGEPAVDLERGVQRRELVVRVQAVHGKIEGDRPAAAQGDAHARVERG